MKKASNPARSRSRQQSRSLPCPWCVGRFGKVADDCFSCLGYGRYYVSHEPAWDSRWITFFALVAIATAVAYFSIRLVL